MGSRTRGGDYDEDYDSNGYMHNGMFVVKYSKSFVGLESCIIRQLIKNKNVCMQHFVNIYQYI